MVISLVRRAMRAGRFCGLVLGVVGATMVSGCSTASRNPDRVVNIERECAIYNKDGRNVLPEPFCSTQFGDSISEDERRIRERAEDFRWDALLRLTVRTPQGVTYVISVPASTSVHLNEPWPPESE